MKKILLALMVCIMCAGAGFCAPMHNAKTPSKAIAAPPPTELHHKKHHGHHAAPPPPPPPVYKFVGVRRHKHHVPLYPYDYYPNGTQVIINTGGVSVGYGIGYGGYINYGGYIGY